MSRSLAAEGSKRGGVDCGVERRAGTYGIVRSFRAPFGHSQAHGVAVAHDGIDRQPADGRERLPVRMRHRRLCREQAKYDGAQGSAVRGVPIHDMGCPRES